MFLVSSARIMETVESTSILLGLASERFPIGVGTKYNMRQNYKIIELRPWKLILNLKLVNFSSFLREFAISSTNLKYN